MVVSASAVLLFGIASFFAIKSRSTSFGAALVVFLFGFYVAATGAAQPIDNVMANLAHTLAQMRA